MSGSTQREAGKLLALAPRMNLFRAAMRVAGRTMVLECAAETIRDCAIAVTHALLGSGGEGFTQLFIEEWSAQERAFMIGPKALQRVRLEDVTVVPPHNIISLRAA